MYWKDNQEEKKGQLTKKAKCTSGEKDRIHIQTQVNFKYIFLYFNWKCYLLNACSSTRLITIKQENEIKEEEEADEYYLKCV